MKFAIATALLLGASQAVEIQAHADEELEAPLPAECTNMEEKIDEASLIDYMQDNEEVELPENDEDVEIDRSIKGSSTQHYGKTKRTIDRENQHILKTQATCLKFVRKHPGHRGVCNYCKNQKAPKVIWKWEATLKVWYRWSVYNKDWMYWGPSKSGFTASGWSWYKGFWHHGGFVYKYNDGYWWRFQNRRWVRYNK